MKQLKMEEIYQQNLELLQCS